MCPVTKRTRESRFSPGHRGTEAITKAIYDINQPPIFFFCKKADLSTLNKAILYVRQNEQTSHLYVVHVYEISTPCDCSFPNIVALFDRMYPKLKIDFLAIEATFGPAVVEWISIKYHTPKNMMFIKQPSHDCAHSIASLGGVRVVTG